MGQTTILLTTRIRALKNRFRHHGPTWWIATSLAGIVIAAAIIGLGELAAPFLISLPADALANPNFTPQLQPPFNRGEPIAGERALDAAFWMTSLVASVLIFRVMELLFRRADIRAVENYPIELRALFADRVLAAFVEALIAGAALSLFFLPLAWHLNAALFGLCAIIAIAGLVVGSSLTLAIQLFAGDSQVPDAQSPQKDQAIRSTGDAYGGGGQIFLFAPALALAFVVVILLFIKLFVGEHLIAGRITRPFELGMAGVFILSAISLFTSYRYFTRAFPAMAARFREADFVVFNPYLPYQKSAFTSQNIFERALPQSARALFRADLLQYGRRYMTSRYLYVFFWAAAAFAFYKFANSTQLNELGRGLPAAIPALLLAVLANPWRRIQNQRANAHTHLALPLSTRDLLTASSLFSAREAMLFTLPYALLALIFSPLSAGFTTANIATAGSIAIAALTCALAVNGITTLGVRILGQSPLITTALPAVASALLLVLGLTSFPIFVIVSTLLLLLNFSAWMPHDRTAFA